jgi:hypothetical protein
MSLVTPYRPLKFECCKNPTCGTPITSSGSGWSTITNKSNTTNCSPPPTINRSDT